MSSQNALIRKTVTLTLTQACNLDCIYCYENHKSTQMMSLETAKRIVDDELLVEDGYEEVEFDLFGGEPFLNFELIKEITDYIIHYDTNKKIVIFIVTNGTLVHGDVQTWLLQNKQYVVCGLSLDGTKEMTDINRSNCFDSIDLDFFKNTYPFQTVKMTVSPETLPMLADGVIYLHEVGFIPSANLAYNIDWSNQDNVSILERELMKLIDYYLSHPDIEATSLLDTDISQAYDSKNIMVPYCGAGKSMRSYDVDGEGYPCQFFMPLSVGLEKAKVAQKMSFHVDYIPESLWDKKCKDCVIKSLCPTCLGANYASSGNMFYHEDNYCKLTKITMLARSYFKAKRLECGQLNLSEQEKAKLAKSILLIQENLRI